MTHRRAIPDRATEPAFTFGRNHHQLGASVLGRGKPSAAGMSANQRVCPRRSQDTEKFLWLADRLRSKNDRQAAQEILKGNSSAGICAGPHRNLVADLDSDATAAAVASKIPLLSVC